MLVDLCFIIIFFVSSKLESSSDVVFVAQNCFVFSYII